MQETRDTLFGVSGQRGKYPQVFIKENDTYTFVGLWDAIEVRLSHLLSTFDMIDMKSLIECDDLPAEVLEANPTIPNFKKVRRQLNLFVYNLCNIRRSPM